MLSNNRQFNKEEVKTTKESKKAFKNLAIKNTKNNIKMYMIYCWNNNRNVYRTRT